MKMVGSLAIFATLKFGADYFPRSPALTHRFLINI